MTVSSHYLLSSSPEKTEGTSQHEETTSSDTSHQDSMDFSNNHDQAPFDSFGDDASSETANHTPALDLLLSPSRSSELSLHSGFTKPLREYFETDEFHDLSEPIREEIIRIHDKKLVHVLKVRLMAIFDEFHKKLMLPNYGKKEKPPKTYEQPNDEGKYRIGG